MFRASTCPSSGGQVVLSEHLVSSLSVNGCTVCRMRADYEAEYDARSKKHRKEDSYIAIYIRNSDLHRDLEVDVVSSEIRRFAQKHEERLHHHENVEAIQLLDNMGIVRRLQRKKPFELVK